MKEERTRMEQVPHKGFQILCIAVEIAVRLIENAKITHLHCRSWMILFAYSLHLTNASISILSKDAKAEGTLVPLGSRDKKLDGSVRTNK